MIRITKEFKFEMAHALHGYDGLCKNIHGHSYRLWVTVRGEILKENGNKKRRNGIRFFLFKKIVKPSIVDKYDHSLVLNAILNTPILICLHLKKYIYFHINPRLKILFLILQV